MQAMKEIINIESLRQQRSSSRRHQQQIEKQVSLRWITGLFKDFSSSYGDTWHRRHSSDMSWEETKLYWSKRLSELTAEQLSYARETFEDTYVRFAPSCGEFKQLARSMPAAEKTEVAEITRSDPETAKKHIDMLKKIAAGCKIYAW